jgi:hypothetical protein
MSPHSHAWGTCGVSNQRSVLPPERQLRAVGERVRRTIGEITHRDQRSDLAADRDGVRGDGKELIECPAFVGLEVRQPQVAEPFDRQHGPDRLADQREQSPHAGVKKHRCVVDDQVLVEAEADLAGQREGRVDAIDPLRDLRDIGA